MTILAMPAALDGDHGRKSVPLLKNWSSDSREAPTAPRSTASRAAFSETPAGAMPIGVVSSQALISGARFSSAENRALSFWIPITKILLKDAAASCLMK
jgi:hypothetical protein